MRVGIVSRAWGVAQDDPLQEGQIEVTGTNLSRRC